MDALLGQPLSERYKPASQQLVCDVDEVGDDGQECGMLADFPVLYFRVLHRKPANMKTVRIPLAAGKRLDQDVIAVTVHTAVDCGGWSTAVNLQPQRYGKLQL